MRWTHKYNKKVEKSIFTFMNKASTVTMAKEDITKILRKYETRKLFDRMTFSEKSSKR